MNRLIRGFMLLIRTKFDISYISINTRYNYYIRWYEIKIKIKISDPKMEIGNGMKHFGAR